MADPESTHHAECWRDHHACAVVRVEALESEVERLRAAILSRGSVRPPGLVMTRETTMEWADEWLRTGGAGQDNKQRGGGEE